jgi:arylsulfatase
MNTNKMIRSSCYSLLAGSLLATGCGKQQADDKSENAVFPGKTGKTYDDSEEYFVQYNPQAPKGAPNVVWILIDDVGFGASSAFGGLIHTPNLDNLANKGLRYTNFHTCAISAPTRASLLTGRNSSAVHMAAFGHEFLSFGFPGWDGHIPSTAGTIAEILRDNGYNTFAVGKYGLMPDAEATDAGPFDRWPSGKGFEHFFGFLGSATDQYKPDLVEDNAHVTPNGRHLSEQITDKAISFIARQQKAAPGKPFFLYYAPGATHSPHQVEKEWRDRYKGQFDEGWDVYRERVIERQKALGLIPADAKLPPREPRLEAWDSIDPERQKLYARFFENYAGFLEYTDFEIGRLVAYLEKSGQLENTAIFVIIGDNGASKEGSFDGQVFEHWGVSDREDLLAENLENIDLIGTPQSLPNYPLGWAQAANTPFRLWKSDAHSEGGTHNPLIVYYPKGIQEAGGIRTQYGHVIDLLPTTTELIGVSQSEQIRGVKQDPVHGTSLFYSFNDAGADSRHTLQHFYIFGARSLYRDGWKAAVNHSADNIDRRGGLFSNAAEIDPKRFEKDVWELYNLNEDFNELHNVADLYPEKLEELKKLFDKQAEKYKLYPLIDWDDITRSHARRKEQAGEGAFNGPAFERLASDSKEQVEQ